MHFYALLANVLKEFDIKREYAYFFVIINHRCVLYLLPRVQYEAFPGV